MIKRLFSSRLKEMLQIFPVVAVIGPRQVGKSTLVLSPEFSENRRYITLDDIAYRSLAEKDPQGVVRQSGLLTIDEVQLAPELLRAIKQEVDTDRTPGRFIVTGSADLNYCADISHVLAGRVGVLRLPPITLFEQQAAGEMPLWMRCALDGTIHCSERADAFDWRHVSSGGFPLSLTAASAQARYLWMESFRSTCLERDLRRISDIGHLAEFARLMEFSTARIGQVLNQASFAREAGLSTATAGRYFSILEAGFLIARLAPYFENLNKRLVKSPKLYWTDTGLASHLLGLGEGVPAENRMRGPLFESFVMMEVQSLLAYYLPSARLYHFRSHDGLEVDGIIDTGQSRIPFEVKAAQTVSVADAASIKRWMELSGHNQAGMVLYSGRETKPLADNIWAVPITAVA
jgi:predicted AAA+ superfamily ATPase